MNRIWLVEMYCDGEWRPTVGGGLTRKTARMEIQFQKFHNPDDKFRVRPYFSQKEEGK